LCRRGGSSGLSADLSSTDGRPAGRTAEKVQMSKTAARPKTAAPFAPSHSLLFVGTSTSPSPSTPSISTSMVIRTSPLRCPRGRRLTPAREVQMVGVGQRVFERRTKQRRRAVKATTRRSSDFIKARRGQQCEASREVARVVARTGKSRPGTGAGYAASYVAFESAGGGGDVALVAAAPQVRSSPTTLPWQDSQGV